MSFIPKWRVEGQGPSAWLLSKGCTTWRPAYGQRPWQALLSCICSVALLSSLAFRPCRCMLPPMHTHLQMQHELNMLLPAAGSATNLPDLAEACTPQASMDCLRPSTAGDNDVEVTGMLRTFSTRTIDSLMASPAFASDAG